MYSASQQSLSQNHQNVVENCAFDIGIHDLELDPQLLEFFSERPDLRVYAKWTFLGLEQTTNLLPVSKAYFDLKVTYCGPPSASLCNYIKETTVVIELIMLDNDGNLQRFGEGNLEVLPALQQPEKRFIRCVPLDITSTGQAFLYCSFKQHNNCCGGPVCPGGLNCQGCDHADCPKRVMPMREFLDIRIGRLKLEKLDFPNRTRAPHIYVEYSILGYCGAHLETGSEPKSELLHFGHRKRLRVTKDNAAHLERMLNRFNPEPLTFIVLTEPCELSRDTDIEEIGSASVSLRHEMLEKDQDLVSFQVPVVDNKGEVKGSLSVTILGIDTLRSHADD